MILSDSDLLRYLKSRKLVVRPMGSETIRENGLDMCLADQIAVHNPRFGDGFILDPSNEEHLRIEYQIRKGQKKLILPPRSQVLLSTKEYIKMPADLVGFIALRSTWARHGLSIPPTIIDAGFSGTITVEVVNNAPHGIELRPGVRFAHVVFATTISPVKNVYSGKYLGQSGIKTSKAVK